MVVVCDEGGNFASSLLSGYIGGANDYAMKIAKIFGAQPVITTALNASSFCGKLLISIAAVRYHRASFGKRYHSSPVTRKICTVAKKVATGFN